MKILDLLKRSLVSHVLVHKNQYGKTVELVVEDVTVKENHRQITADARENDWWGDSCDWQTIIVTFVDGSKIEMNLDTEIVFKIKNN